MRLDHRQRSAETLSECNGRQVAFDVILPQERARHQQLAREKVHAHLTALLGSVVNRLFRANGRIAGGPLGLDVVGDELGDIGFQHAMPELVRDQERLVKG